MRFSQHLSSQSAIPLIKMNLRCVTVVCCIGSGQGDLGFALDVPRNQAARRLKKMIRGTIWPDVPPGKKSLYCDVCSRSIDSYDRFWLGLRSWTGLCKMTLLNDRTIADTFGIGRTLFVKPEGRSCCVGSSKLLVSSKHCEA